MSKKKNLSIALSQIERILQIIFGEKVTRTKMEKSKKINLEKKIQCSDQKSFLLNCSEIFRPNDKKGNIS